MTSTNEAHPLPNRDAARGTRRGACASVGRDSCGRLTRSRAGDHRRRGSIYAVVLGMAILVSLIGLSAVAVGRVNLRVASMGSDGTDAEVLALSAIEHAAATINTDATWRAKYTGVSRISPVVAMGRGSFKWDLVDEPNGSLSVRVFGTGTVGEASRCYSVVFSPAGANLATNPGAESGATGYEVQGTDCAVNALTDDPHDGATYILVKNRLTSTAGPQMNLTGKVSSGTAYYCELWVKTTTASEDPWLSFVIKKAGSNDTQVRVRGQTAKSTEWTRVSGTLKPSWSVTPDSVYWRIETNSTAQDFKIDDLKIVQSSGSTPMAPAAETWRQDPVPHP